MNARISAPVLALDEPTDESVHSPDKAATGTLQPNRTDGLSAPIVVPDHALVDGNHIPVSRIPAPNVASVPQRSPLRYPGGKTWLVPHIRAWLAARPRPPVLFEPFCGGGIVSLTAAAENLADRCVLAELDRDVAAFWHAALNHTDQLCDKIDGFEATLPQVATIGRSAPADLVEHGFRTLVLNRTRRSGILARGASFIRTGENGKGVASRWYPETLVRRLREIATWADRMVFCETDGLKMLESMAQIDGSAIFVDPPYTAGGKRAGRRLYAHHEIDHKFLFSILADTNVDFLMTYDMSDEIVSLVRHHAFVVVRVAMKTSHHTRLDELVVTPRHLFYP